MPKPRQSEHNKERLAGYTSDDYHTPAWVFDELNITFDLDPCSPGQNLSNVPATHAFTIADDGLNQPWHGNVFMNPPFSQSKLWVQKFIDHEQGIALLPTSRSHWFIDIWNTATAIALPNQLFNFERPDKRKANIFMPVLIIAYGKDNATAIARLGHAR